MCGSLLPFFPVLDTVLTQAGSNGRCAHWQGLADTMNITVRIPIHAMLFWGGGRISRGRTRPQSMTIDALFWLVCNLWHLAGCAP